LNNVTRVLLALGLLMVLISCASDRNGFPAAAVGSSVVADTILTNGKFYTVNPATPWVDAVAISNGKYVFAGSSEAVKTYQGSATKVIDLAGKMAMPGINDTHIHPLMGAISTLFECTFDFTAAPEAVRASIKACVETQPDTLWIRGGQWGSDFFSTHQIASPRGFLDELSSTHAIFLNDDSGHNGWANSKALQLAGIDAATPDPKNGTIVRDSAGKPTGLLLETAARLLDDVVEPWSDEQHVEAAAYAAKLANSFGMTGLKDAGAFQPAAMAFSQVAARGLLTVHAATCIRTPYGARTEPLDYAEIEAVSDRFASNDVHTRFVKLFLDGVPTPARTAAMIHPYQTDAVHTEAVKGDLHIDPQLLMQDVVELDRRGFTIKMHTAGDRAVQVALDAIAAARKSNGDSGLRHELAHAGYIDPADLPRFAELDAVADFSPYLWHPSPIIQAVLSAVGEERGSRYYPTRTLLDSGAHVAVGSDWPAAVPSPNPWIGMQALVTRKDPRGETRGALWPEEAITLAEAVALYTMAGARALRLEEITGSIEVGKSADLIVIGQNLFDVPIESVADTKVLMTLFRGKTVFDSSG